jgi:hypothetical protein
MHSKSMQKKFFYFFLYLPRLLVRQSASSLHCRSAQLTSAKMSSLFFAKVKKVRDKINLITYTGDSVANITILAGTSKASC